MALLACALAGVRPAHAEDDADRKRVVVLQFGGPQGARVHAAVVGGLKRQVNVVDADEFGEVLASAEGPTRPDRIAAACREMHVDAAIEGAMRRAGRVWSVEVFVRDCANGEKIVPSGRATFSMRNLGGIAAIRGGIWGRIGEAILGAGGAGGGEGQRVAAAPRPPARPAARGGSDRPTAPAPPARPAAAPRRAVSSMETCTFEEDEPPEGFPGYGDWVRRRNAFINRCEAERVRRAQEAVRQRQEAERRAQEEARENARRAAEAERRRREEADRARRAEEVRRQREEDDRRRAAEEARRRRLDEERAEERRRRDEESRVAAERRRREEEEASEERRREEEERPRRDRRRRDEEIERDVAAYRARLERERLAALEERDYDERPRREEYEDEEPPPEEEPSYDDEEDRPRPRREGRRRYEEDEGASYEEEGEDSDPVYDPEREDEEEDRRDDERPSLDGDEEEEDEEDENDRPGSGSRAARAPTVLHIGAGIGFVNRQMTVAVEGSEQPRSYAAPGYPEISVLAQFFPGALTKSPGTLGGLGVYGVFRRHLFLQTTGVDSTTNEAIDIPTAEQELAGGAIFRVPMGNGPRSPVFSIAVAYGYFQFLLDPKQMLRLDASMQMPTMTYVNIIGEAGVAIPLDDRGLAVDLGATYRYVLDVGQAARDIFGADTKGGYAFGARVALGGEAAFIAKGLAWSISADALIFNTEFSGASSADGGRIGGFPSGSDRYLRGTAMLGYRFR